MAHSTREHRRREEDELVALLGDTTVYFYIMSMVLGFVCLLVVCRESIRESKLTFIHFRYASHHALLNVRFVYIVILHK